jgi:hypothetical protein
VPTRRRGKPAKRVTAETRTEDDRLRESLRHADLKKFDKALAKAIKPSR